MTARTSRPSFARSSDEQRISTIPRQIRKQVGSHVAAMEALGIRTERAALVLETAKIAGEVQDLVAPRKELQDEIDDSRPILRTF